MKILTRKKNKELNEYITFLEEEINKDIQYREIIYSLFDEINNNHKKQLVSIFKFKDYDYSFLVQDLKGSFYFYLYNIDSNYSSSKHQKLEDFCVANFKEYSIDTKEKKIELLEIRNKFPDLEGIGLASYFLKKCEEYLKGEKFAEIMGVYGPEKELKQFYEKNDYEIINNKFYKKLNN